MINSPFTPPTFFGQLSEGTGANLDLASTCDCHRSVARCSQMMTALIDQTEQVLNDARALIDQAGAIDWEGQAARAFRENLIRASDLADDQASSLMQARQLLDEETRP